MSSLSSRTFIVRISNSYGPSHSVRRVFINADVLKAAKIVAGDVVAVCAADKPESNTSDERFTAGSKSEGTEVRRAFAAGVAWPSISLSPECEQQDISCVVLIHISNPTQPSWFPHVYY
jgi:AAA family ATPase